MPDLPDDKIPLSELKGLQMTIQEIFYMLSIRLIVSLLQKSHTQNPRKH